MQHYWSGSVELILYKNCFNAIRIEHSHIMIGAYGFDGPSYKSDHLITSKLNVDSLIIIQVLIHSSVRCNIGAHDSCVYSWDPFISQQIRRITSMECMIVIIFLTSSFSWCLRFITSTDHTIMQSTATNSYPAQLPLSISTSSRSCNIYLFN
jgi:hypothetical protein